MYRPFLDRLRHVVAAIWGRGFCVSALYGLKLAVTNMGRLAFVTILSKCLILLGTIEISVASAGVCALTIYLEDATPPWNVRSQAIKIVYDRTVFSEIACL